LQLVVHDCDAKAVHFNEPSVPLLAWETRTTSSQKQCFKCQILIFYDFAAFDVSVSFCMSLCITWELLGTSPYHTAWHHGTFVASSEVSPVTPGAGHPRRGREDLVDVATWTAIKNLYMRYIFMARQQKFKFHGFLLDLILVFGLVSYFIMEPINIS
jgi:hypothetical protein